jgi:hypothetical protein
MNGKIELTFIGILVLMALLSLGLMSDPVADPDPLQHDPYTASGLAWNN